MSTFAMSIPMNRPCQTRASAITTCLKRTLIRLEYLHPTADAAMLLTAWLCTRRFQPTLLSVLLVMVALSSSSSSFTTTSFITRVNAQSIAPSSSWTLNPTPPNTPPDPEKTIALIFYSPESLAPSDFDLDPESYLFADENEDLGLFDESVNLIPPSFPLDEDILQQQYALPFATCVRLDQLSSTAEPLPSSELASNELVKVTHGQNPSHVRARFISAVASDLHAALNLYLDTSCQVSAGSAVGFWNNSFSFISSSHPVESGFPNSLASTLAIRWEGSASLDLTPGTVQPQLFLPEGALLPSDGHGTKSSSERDKAPGMGIAKVRLILGLVSALAILGIVIAILVLFRIPKYALARTSRRAIDSKYETFSPTSFRSSMEPESLGKKSDETFQYRFPENPSGTGISDRTAEVDFFSGAGVGTGSTPGSSRVGLRYWQDSPRTDPEPHLGRLAYNQEAPSPSLTMPSMVLHDFKRPRSLGHSYSQSHWRFYPGSPPLAAFPTPRPYSTSILPPLALESLSLPATTTELSGGPFTLPIARARPFQARTGLGISTTHNRYSCPPTLTYYTRHDWESLYNVTVQSYRSEMDSEDIRSIGF